MSDNIQIDITTTQDNIDIEYIYPQGPTGPQGPQGVNTWGSLSGTLSAQTDLWAYLSATATLLPTTTYQSASGFWQSTFATVCALSASWEESADIIPTVTNYLSTNNVLISSLNIINKLTATDIFGAGTEAIFSDTSNSTGFGQGTLTLNFTNGVYILSSLTTLGNINGSNLNISNWDSVYTSYQSASGFWQEASTITSQASSIIITSGGNTRNANITIGTNDDYHLRFETSNSPRMTILSGGEVGIGTSITETQTAGSSGLRIKNNLLVGGNTTLGDANTDATIIRGTAKIADSSSTNGILFGSGDANYDTNLYRSAADTLKTDDTLVIGTLNTSTTDNSVIVEASGLLNKRTINSRVWDTNATFLSGSPTTNTILKSTGPNTIGNSTITDNGTTVTVGANTNITGTLSSTNFRTPESTSIGAGTNALVAITNGTANTAFGAKTLQFNQTGSSNCAFGEEALRNATGSNNCAFGANTLRAASNTASDNTGFGHGALIANTSGTDNAAVGRSAAESINTGSRNTALGAYALSTLQSGNNNVGIGRNVQASATTVSNEVTVGNGTVVARFQGAASGWTFTSDGRDKSDIENLELGLDFINQLQPRKFKWAIRNSDVDQGKEAAGFIAQEVLSVTQANQAECLGLVDTNDPNHFTLGQTSLIPVLVNAIKELKAEIEILKAR